MARENACRLEVEQRPRTASCCFHLRGEEGMRPTGDSEGGDQGVAGDQIARTLVIERQAAG